jgi:hypothetical protein
MIRTSLFIKSWREDIRWLRYCLRFLEKNWREHSDVVIALDPDCREAIDTDDYDLDLRRVTVEPWPDGYSHAMFVKACADKYCQGEAIILLDSDTMLLEPTDAGYFFDELPIIPWILYAEHQTMYPHSPWQKVTEKVMQVRTDRHFMPCMPILYWVSTFSGLRHYVVGKHKAKIFEEVIFSDVPFDPANFAEHPISFCDYDCLGLYASIYEPEKYVFRHAEQLKPNPFKQFHSWSEWNDETPRILEHCLNEAVTV